MYVEEKTKLINKGKKTGKRTHSNANTRINARDSSFREEREKKKIGKNSYQQIIKDQESAFQTIMINERKKKPKDILI